jgi:hypothetical protein
MELSWEPLLKGRLSTVGLQVMIAYFVKKINIYFSGLKAANLKYAVSSPL